MLVVGIAGFTVLSLVSGVFNSTAQVTADGDVQLLSLNGDQNVPTWYSSSMLLVCAGLLATIAASSERNNYRRHWAALSAIFLFLSMDEAASIHEKAGSVLAALVEFGSFSHYVWVIIYGPLVLIIGLTYWRFLMQLPTKVRRLFFTAGFLYVGGALGMEVIDGLYAISYGRSSLGYLLLTQVEEVLEMLGVAVFFFALLSYISLYERGLILKAK